MESNKLHEQIATIDTILNVNSGNTGKQKSSGVSGFTKSIVNRYKNASET